MPSSLGGPRKLGWVAFARCGGVLRGARSASRPVVVRAIRVSNHSAAKNGAAENGSEGRHHAS
jgi:hypothetical protein